MTDDSAEPVEPKRAFRAAIRDALTLLDAHDVARPHPAAPPAVALPSLLEQCRALLAEASTHSPPPIRTIHHFACTGGTLISRCVAAAPGAHVLSEVDPLSPMPHRSSPLFTPTDLIGLLRHGSRPVEPELLVATFLDGLQTVYDDARRRGIDLVLRDHAHSHFCWGDHVAPRPTLAEIVGRRFPVRSIVTVRHPLDSFLSLAAKRWSHFSPFTIEEYCRRYLMFLDRHRDVKIIRYEDFVRQPQGAMDEICAALGLVPAPHFTDVFPAIRLSGDSGRSGRRIAPRPRRPLAPDLLRDAQESPAFAALVARLGYDEGDDLALEG
jgi:hypothetical protein